MYLERKAPFATTSFNKRGWAYFKDGPIYCKYITQSGTPRIYKLLLFPLVHKCSHYKIVVVRGSNVTNTRMEIPDNMLLPDSQRQTFYYVAATFSVEEFQCTFSIGNGKTDNETFVNLPLSSDQEYTVFIRLYSSLNVSYLIVLWKLI